MSELKFDTTIGEDVEVVIHFDYQPEEKRTFDCPGCPEEVVINDVLLQSGESIVDLLNDKALDEIEPKCFDHMNSLYCEEE